MIDLMQMLNKDYKINKPIKLYEFFAGYGSQSLALKYNNIPFQHGKICEWAVPSIQAYKDLHYGEDNINYSANYLYGDIISKLLSYGISSDYNVPMSYDQIKRKGEQWARNVYNNIVATNNLVNIQNVKGYDLQLDKNYCNIITYSFPCQDLSLAGKRAGMSDTSTRSGMLWEVERILNELDIKPDILLMENVPQVHGTGAIKDFNKWCDSLCDMGYVNFWKDLNAKDYEIPQNRNRCFMVSIYNPNEFVNYKFPNKKKLQLKLKDLLENEVDEKYYLSDKQIGEIQRWNAYEKPLETMEKTDNSGISPTMTTRSGAYAAGMILVKNNTKQGYLEVTSGDGIDISGRMEYHRGTVQKDMAQTIKTSSDVGVVVCGNYSPSGHEASKIVDSNGLAPTTKENHGTINAVCENYAGTYQYAKSDEFMQGKDRFQKGKDVADCIQTSQKEGVVEFGTYYTWKDKQGNINTQCNRAANPENSALTAACANTGNVYTNLRIRKLTPKECLRLMGVRDEDISKMAQHQSESSLYHLAGDSIVVNVLQAIFKELI